MLLDTDVLIDIALDRRPHSGPSSELLDRVECGPRRAFVAWHTLSNFYYLVTSARGDADTRDFICRAGPVRRGCARGCRGGPLCGFSSDGGL